MRTDSLSCALLAVAQTAPRGCRPGEVLGWISSDIRYRVLGGEERPLPNPVPRRSGRCSRTAFRATGSRIRTALNLKVGAPRCGRWPMRSCNCTGFSDIRDIDSHDPARPCRSLLPGSARGVRRYQQPVRRCHPALRSAHRPADGALGRSGQVQPISNINTLDLSDPLPFGPDARQQHDPCRLGESPSAIGVYGGADSDLPAGPKRRAPRQRSARSAAAAAL